MPVRIGLTLLTILLTAGAIPAQAPALSEDQIRELLRRVADADLKNDHKQRDYTFTERQEEHKLDRKGNVKSTESKTYEVMELYGSQVRRLVAKDDQPLSGDAAKKEDDRLQKIVDKRARESGADREKREARESKEHEQDRQFVREVADAYDFHMVGVESLDGRDTYVIDAEPRPGYQPHLKDARILPKFRFRAWIDKDESEWKKLDIQCIDTVSFGLVLARIHKGSRIVIEQTRVNDEVWLPLHIAVKVDARVALLKEFNFDEDVTFRDYKKFRTDTKVTPVGEVIEPH
ncbi:MAG TPA: hypothetical protein VMT86_03215 [Bryobacteraceae bacterium]|nr:hypothetical protein [Bryobacteraceae bacterium]